MSNFSCTEHIILTATWVNPITKSPVVDSYVKFKVARYSFSGSIPPKFDYKLRRHKQRFGKIATTVVLDKNVNLL